MKKYIYIVVFFFFWSINAQENVEQIAFDYFFDNIIENEFERIKINFSGNTEPTISGTLYEPECINKTDLVYLQDYGFKKALSIKIDKKEYIQEINNRCVKGKKDKILLRIYRNLKMDNLNIVLISVAKKNKSITHFFIKINQQLEIVDWCKTTSII